MSSKINFLLSYPYFDSKENLELMSRIPRNSYRLIVDSGAFTAWNSGKEIRLDDYCRFLDKISGLQPFHAVQLDVIGNAEKSFENLKIMKSRGYDVMPVFTRGESLDMLEAYYQMTDYIMFGGVAFGSKNKNYVKWFLERNKGRKAHWLGFVKIPYVKHYRPESVDSSSWSGSARFGGIHLYDGKGEIKAVDKKTFVSKLDNEMMIALNRIGLDVKEIKMLLKDSCWSRPWRFTGEDWSIPKEGMVQFVSTCSHLLRSYEVEKKIKTKIYLAGGMVQVNRTIFWALEFLKSRRVII